MGRGTNNNLLYGATPRNKSWRETILVNQQTLGADDHETLFYGSSHPGTEIEDYNGSASLLLHNKHLPVKFTEQLISRTYQSIIDTSIEAITDGTIIRPREIISNESFNLADSSSDLVPVVCFPIINTVKQSGRDFVKRQDYQQSQQQVIDYSASKLKLPSLIKYCLAADIFAAEQAFENQGTWKYDHQYGDLFYYLDQQRVPAASVWTDSDIKMFNS